MNNPDLAAMVDYTLRKRPDRGDERFSHVSDAYKCNLAVWARRRGLPQLPYSPETLVKFEMGHEVEAMVAKAIRENYVGDSTQGRRIEWNPQTGECRDLAENAEPAAGFMVGHLDIELTDDEQVVEVKSTSFYGGKVPQAPSEHYVVQASTYATALKSKAFAIVIVDRISGKVVPFWFDAADFYQEATERAIEVMEATDPANPFPPEANPQQSWACAYCDFGACERNRNPARKEAVDSFPSLTLKAPV